MVGEIVRGIGESNEVGKEVGKEVVGAMVEVGKEVVGAMGEVTKAIRERTETEKRKTEVLELVEGLGELLKVLRTEKGWLGVLTAWAAILSGVAGAVGAAATVWMTDLTSQALGLAKREATKNEPVPASSTMLQG